MNSEFLTSWIQAECNGNPKTRHLKTENIWKLDVLAVRFLKDPTNHDIRPFENWTKKCMKSWMFGFQVFGIQMVTGIEMVTVLAL